MLKALARLVFAGLLMIHSLEVSAQQSDVATDLGELLTGDILITADELTYDQDTDSVVASGNVEVAQSGRVLRAASIRYQRRDGVVTASGDVALVEPNGEVMFADSAELTGDLRNGIIRRLNVLLTDRSRLTAVGARRFDGNRTVMRRAVFSPCELCADDPAAAPLWQLKAETVVHDQAARALIYYDASLEAFGLPFLYTPYFRHPDPSVERQSGFLSPTYGSSSALGAEVTTPYYWAIDPSRDMTFAPRFTTEEGVVLTGAYRERTRDGQFNFDASITDANTAAEDGQRLRGHIFGRGLFTIDEDWRWGFELQRALDDTYLSRYGVSSEDELVTALFAEQFNRRSYMSGYGYLFQNLRAGFQSDQTPIVLPLLDAHLVSEPAYLSGYATLDANLMLLERFDGIDSRRISIAGGWHRPMVLAGGHILRVDASLRGDLYHAYIPADYGQPYGPTKSETTGRVVPQLAVEWRYPLITRIGPIRQLIEPIVQGVISPNGRNPEEIPNEDSLDVEFDHTNLFSTDRFTGLDRFETGQRVNFGVRLGFYGPGGGRATALIGQSVRAKDDLQFGTLSGLEHRTSDYVGHILMQPLPLVDLSLRFRLDHRHFVMRRNEVDLLAGPRWLRGRIGFADLARRPQSTMGDFVGGREVSLSVRAKPLENWTLSAAGRRDLKEDDTINWSVGIAYEDECISMGTGVTRSFTRDRDIRPDTVWHLTVRLRNAG